MHYQSSDVAMSTHRAFAANIVFDSAGRNNVSYVFYDMWKQMKGEINKAKAFFDEHFSQLFKPSLAFEYIKEGERESINRFC